VRMAGRISDWNDEKGFGFVEPSGGGDRAFVHINAFQRGSRRPVTGDLISYRPGKDSRGRLQAQEVRHAGQRIAEPRKPSRVPRAALGAAVLIGVVGSGLAGWIPVILTGTYLGMSVMSYLMYVADKLAAERNAQRTPEKSLHLVDFLGGWPGALIAQQHSRHKTVKLSFQKTFWLTVFLNVVVACWVVWSGLAEAMMESLSR